jgi:GcrA cell cycle regulator
MPSPLPWTPERVETLTCLWRRGVSARQIAKALGGVSRNAVIGKVHRLGLSGRARPTAPGRKPAKTLRPQRCGRRRVAPRRGTAAPAIEIAAAGPGLATVETVSAHACRWPIGDPKADDFSLCGRPATQGAYCAAHAAAAYRPLARKPAADHLLKLAGRALAD